MECFLYLGKVYSLRFVVGTQYREGRGAWQSVVKALADSSLDDEFKRRLAIAQCNILLKEVRKFI